MDLKVIDINSLVRRRDNQLSLLLKLYDRLCDLIMVLFELLFTLFGVLPIEAL